MLSDNSVIAIKFKTSGFGASSGRVKKQPVRLVISRQDFDKTNIKNMSDTQILSDSFEHAREKSRKTMAGKLLSALPLLFMTSVAAMHGVLKKGALSSKMFTALTAAFALGLSKTVCDKVDDISGRVKSKSSKFKNIEKKHPVLSITGDFALKSALIMGAFIGISKGGKVLQEHFAPSVEMLSKGLKRAAKTIDASNLGKRTVKLSENFGKFVQKHPNISNFVAKNSNLVPAAFLLGWMGIGAALNKKVIENRFNFAAQRAENLVLLRGVAQHIDAP